MKFTDGFWQLRPGVRASYAKQVAELDVIADELRITAPTRWVATRGDTLNQPVLTVRVAAVADGVIRVRASHHEGAAVDAGFDFAASPLAGAVEITGDAATVRAGALVARVATGSFDLVFDGPTGRLTANGPKSIASIDVDAGAQVEPPPVGLTRTGRPHFTHAQFDLGVGEQVYGLGERFGPLVKNGQVVDIWNADGGTSSEQAYKNVPFYLTNRGYGVFVNHSGHVSFEVGSEAVERVQASVDGEEIEYFVIAGPTPKEVIDRYTALTGRPPIVPAWSFGLWLTTSFTTSYDEATVNGFIDGMRDRRIPLSVFHFDCFWMHEYQWCDFEWDARVFPDPDGMLARLHDKDIKVCVWINPYIAQRSPLFAEGAAAGHLLKRADGSVWQWDLWQPGMAVVDFTSPAAVEWFQSKLARLVDQGVDAFKTDFGERIPTDVVYADGSDPVAMHNRYTDLYNKAVFEVLETKRGAGEAILFARSATAGGQRYPAHWGGDSTSTFTSMAETLRGGLSLAMSGFAHWSHDIGGFEGTPDADVFKRWTAFGLLSSHSRFHGSDSYRVPWIFDDDESAPDSAVSVTRKFARLKNRLAPYLVALTEEAHRSGAPLMRPMLIEFPEDPTCAFLDRQYLLGPDLLVAPVFSAAGDVEFYLPAGRWTDWWSGRTVEGGRWLREQHGFETLPLYIRAGAVIPLSANEDRPDVDHTDGLTLLVTPGDPGDTVVSVGGSEYAVTRSADGVRATGPTSPSWSVGLADGTTVASADGEVFVVV